MQEEGVGAPQVVAAGARPGWASAARVPLWTRSGYRFAWKAAVSAPKAIAVTRWSPTMRDGSATPIRMGIRRVSVIEAYGDHGVKPSLHRPPILAVRAGAADRRVRDAPIGLRAPRQPRTAGPCWSRTSIRVAPPASPPSAAAIAAAPTTGASSRTSAAPSTSAPTTASTATSSGEATAQRGGRGWSRTSTPAAARAPSTGSRPSTA